jgi:gluconokinase
MQALQSKPLAEAELGAKKKGKVFVFMGVSGCGKSSVASQVAQKLGAAFLDGDFLHPRSNIEKMASGQALNDTDRAPWLAALNEAIFAMQHATPVSLLVCSALKQSYRNRLRDNNPNVQFVFLHGNFELIQQRLTSRVGHFQKSGMLVSQFQTLEIPTSDETDVIHIDISASFEAVVNASHRAIMNQG